MRTRSLRWRLTWVSVKCVLVAWLIWLGCQVWQLSRAHYGFWDESQREVASQILQSMPDGLDRLPSRVTSDVYDGRRDHKMSWQVWAHGRNVVYSPAAPGELSEWPSLDWGPVRDHAWQLVGPDGQEVQVRHRPRYITDDMTALRQAALHCVGIVQLPWMVVEEDLCSGALQEVMPGWAPKGGIVHAVFPSRRGLLPAVRTLIDYMASHIRRS